MTVTDDSVRADSAEFWRDDSIELYIDADNSKGGSYDGQNDFQFGFTYDGGVMAGINSVDHTSGIDHT